MKTILIVDDEASMHVIYEDTLAQSREEFRLISAFTVEEALKKLKTTDIDLIILDIIMKPLSGMHLYLKMRRDKKIQNKKIPIIISSVLKEKELEQLNDSERLVIVEKPFTPEVLLGKIRQLLKEAEDNRSKEEC